MTKARQKPPTEIPTVMKVAVQATEMKAMVKVWTMAMVKGMVSVKSPMTLMQRTRMRRMSRIMERIRKEEQCLFSLD